MAEQISFFDATGLPPEIAARLKTLQQQEEVANALQAQGMQQIPLSQAGGQTARISPFQGLNKLVEAFAGAYGKQSNAEALGKLSQDYQTGQQGELEKLIKAQSDPSAALSAAGSTYPKVSALGTMLAKENFKLRVTPEEIGKWGTWASPESLVAAVQVAGKGGDPLAVLKPKPEYHFDGGLVTDARDPTKVVADYRKVWGPLQDVPSAGGGAPDKAQVNLATGETRKFDNAPKTTITNTVNPAKQENAFTAALGPLDAKELKASATKARGIAGHTLVNINRIRDVVNSGQAITGPTANIRTFFLRVGSTLGLTGKSEEETLAKTRSLVQGLAQSQADAAKFFEGQGQISNFERSKIDKMAIGAQNMTPAEIMEALEYTDKVARLDLGRHKTLVDQAEKAYPGANMGMNRVDIPPPYEDPLMKFKVKEK